VQPAGISNKLWFLTPMLTNEIRALHNAMYCGSDPGVNASEFVNTVKPVRAIPLGYGQGGGPRRTCSHEDCKDAAIPADSFCKTCDIPLCDEHVKIHQRKPATALHELLRVPFPLKGPPAAAVAPSSPTAIDPSVHPEPTAGNDASKDAKILPAEIIQKQKKRTAAGFAKELRDNIKKRELVEDNKTKQLQLWRKDDAGAKNQRFELMMRMQEQRLTLQSAFQCALLAPKHQKRAVYQAMLQQRAANNAQMEATLTGMDNDEGNDNGHEGDDDDDVAPNIVIEEVDDD